MNILERLLVERGISVPSEAIPPPLPPVKSPLALVLERTGITLEQLQAEAAEAEIASDSPPPSVQDTPELRRIVNLPRRASEGPEELAEAMTAAFKTEWGQQALRPIQALALHDLHQFGGIFGPIRVGGGKTLISYMAPYVMDSHRPLLVVPAKLKEKTRREFRKLAGHWMGPHPDGYRIESYELLGRKQAHEFLNRYRPDLIVFDEAHKLKNTRAAVTRKVRRYIEENPGTVVVAMSGTITKRSLRDFAHVARWCLPRTCPVPTVYTDLETWANCLDEKVNAFRRVQPGALIELCSPEERKELAAGWTSGSPEELSLYRKAFRSRMVETPGVVATQEGALGVSLTIEEIRPLHEDPKVEGVFQTLREDWTTPDEHPIADAIAHWRHARELGLGMFYRWNPRPPPEWLFPRADWAKFCREILKYNRRGLDSESQVVAAVEKGLYSDGGLLARWRAVKDTFTPHTEAVWFSSEALDTAQRWMEDVGPTGGGIVWVEHVEFGRELSRRSGVPFYHAKGRDEAAGRFVEDHPPGHMMICSIASNSEGRNLQAWNQNYVVCPPPNGAQWEQMMGRTHRDGQEAEEVSFRPYVGCYEHAACFHQAVADSRYQQDLQGQAQKLQYADVEFPSMETVVGRATRAGGGGWYRWRK